MLLLLKKMLSAMPGGLLQKLQSTNPQSTSTSKAFSKQHISNIPSIKKDLFIIYISTFIFTLQVRL